jgi:hypothetical protein
MDTANDTDTVWDSMGSIQSGRYTFHKIWISQKIYISSNTQLCYYSVSRSFGTTQPTAFWNIAHSIWTEQSTLILPHNKATGNYPTAQQYYSQTVNQCSMFQVFCSLPPTTTTTTVRQIFANYFRLAIVLQVRCISYNLDRFSCYLTQ